MLFIRYDSLGGRVNATNVNVRHKVMRPLTKV